MLAGSAQAAIIYNEAVDGDAPNGAWADLGTLTPGANTIVGKLEGSRPSAPLDDVDNFRFELAPGTKLVSITLDSFDFDPDITNPPLVVTLLGDGAGGGRPDRVGVDLLAVFGADAPGPGSYILSFISPNVHEIAYQATFNVASDEVPEPGSLSLLLLGAGALFAVRRKRRSA